MKPVYPEPGTHWGECYRWTIASWIELPGLEVPHIWRELSIEEKGTVEQLEAGNLEMRRFLWEQGYYTNLVTIGPHWDADQVIEQISIDNPGCVWMFSGWTADETAHCVLVQDGKIVYNVNNAIPIVRPIIEQGDEFWMVQFLGSRDAVKPYWGRSGPGPG